MLHILASSENKDEKEIKYRNSFTILRRKKKQEHVHYYWPVSFITNIALVVSTTIYKLKPPYAHLAFISDQLFSIDIHLVSRIKDISISYINVSFFSRHFLVHRVQWSLKYHVRTPFTTIPHHKIQYHAIYAVTRNCLNKYDKTQCQRMRPMINDFYFKITFRFSFKKEFVGYYEDDQEGASAAASAAKRSRYFWMSDQKK